MPVRAPEDRFLKSRAAALKVIARDYQPVLVTGGAGFIGASLVHALVKVGIKPHLLAHRSGPRSSRIAPIASQCAWHRCSLTDHRAVQNVIARVRPRLVYHLAAYGGSEWQSDPRRIFATNLTGTWNLIEALRTSPPLLMVNAGSSSEYGYQDHASREEDRLDPNSHYAIAKAAQTALCRLHHRIDGLPAVTLRFYSIFGPLEDPRRLMPTIIRRARRGLPLRMADPRIARDFVTIEDALDALFAVAKLRRAAGDVINLASGRQVSLKQVVDALSACAGLPPVHATWGKMAARKWDTFTWRGNPSRAERLLGWKARRSLAEGLDDMIRRL